MLAILSTSDRNHCAMPVRVRFRSISHDNRRCARPRRFGNIYAFPGDALESSTFRGDRFCTCVIVAAARVGANVRARVVFGGGDSPGLGSTLNRVSVSWVGGWGVWSVVVTQNFGQPADTFLRIRASSRPSPWLPCSGAALPTHMRCKALEPLWFRRLRRAAHFVRVASGQLVDRKTRSRAHTSRPRSGALPIRRAIGFESRNAVVVDASRSLSGCRPRCRREEAIWS